MEGSGKRSFGLKSRAGARGPPLRRLPAPGGGPGEVELAAAGGAEAHFSPALLAWPQRPLTVAEAAPLPAALPPARPQPAPVAAPAVTAAPSATSTVSLGCGARDDAGGAMAAVREPREVAGALPAPRPEPPAIGTRAATVTVAPSSRPPGTLRDYGDVVARHRGCSRGHDDGSVGGRLGCLTATTAGAPSPRATTSGPALAAPGRQRQRQEEQRQKDAGVGNANGSEAARCQADEPEDAAHRALAGE